jgi:hypothetical protein
MKADASVFMLPEISALSVPVAICCVGVGGVLLDEEAEK